MSENSRKAARVKLAALKARLKVALGDKNPESKSAIASIRRRIAELALSRQGE
jgi:hypothetical protein